MSTTTERLGLNFHETFLPERTYLSKLMGYASNVAATADKETIHEATGIPTGKSSGKVTSTLRYAEAMGLVRRDKGLLSLTPFGQVVKREDARLDEPLTQWLAHLHLARRHGGAELWYRVFAESTSTLGRSFLEGELLAWVEQNAGTDKLGPLGGMYVEPNSFGKSKIVEVEGERWKRHHAPTASYYAPGYAFMMLSLMDHYFPQTGQVTAKAFEEQTRFFSAANWTEKQCQDVFDELSAIGAFRIERQLDDAVMTILEPAATFLPLLYDDLP